MLEKSYLEFAPVPASIGFDHVAPARKAAPASGSLLQRAGHALAAAGREVAGWRRRSQARAALLALDDRLLADIGLRRGDIDLVLDDLQAQDGGK
jgi:uncharacterized protein YjiS (DUF1127 family)